EKTHRPGFHRIYQPASVNKLRRTADKRLIEFRQILWNCGQIRILNHKDIAPCGLESHTYSVPFTFSGLFEGTKQVWTAIGFHFALDYIPRIVATVALNKNDLSLDTQHWNQIDGWPD